jgi:hypothetical protein
MQVCQLCPAVLVLSTWQGVGLPMTVYLADLQDIHDSLYEAAQLDGAGDVPVRLPDGVHIDLLNGTQAQVQNGQMRLPESAVIVRLETGPGQPPAKYKPFYSTMLDYRRHHE